MKRILFDAEPQHVFVYGDVRVNGGQEFLVADDDAAEDLLAAPHNSLRELPLDLTTLTRDELNDFATRAGVKKPERLSNKDLVIAAINDAADGDSLDDSVAPEGDGSEPPADTAGDTNNNEGA